MILIDTNVISEFMNASPTDSVRAWLNAQDPVTLYLPAIAIAEISFGLGVLPTGRRRTLLSERFERFIALVFQERILGFDAAATRVYGEIRAHRRAEGRPISNFDAQIAAIARTAGLAVATRNVRDFDDCGVQVLNPFEVQAGAPRD
ncbi:MAG: type II toxin-antitoxin system VapC family toxin [Wenzhouxiangellaceae bacterium]